MSGGEGRTFGRWHTTGERRSGGQATVFRVVGPRGESGALKLANVDEPARAALRAEREQLAAVVARDASAPGWLAVPYDRGEDEAGRPWVVLPWFEHSLRSWMHQQAPPLRTRLEALRLAVEAVCRLHESGPSRGQPRLHLDLKPDNFLVEAGPSGLRVVLADLGGARAGNLALDVEPTDSFTPRYSPPEVVLGLQRPADPAVDGHALAVVLYEGLTGVEPRSVCGPWPLTAPGRELMESAGAGGSARLAELRALPLRELLALDEMEALSPRDEARLRNELTDLLAAGEPGAAGRVEAVLAPLLGALRAALEPDPERRGADTRKLAAALEAALAVCGGGAGPAAAPWVAPAPAAGPAAAAVAPAPPTSVAPAAPTPPVAPAARPAPQPATEADEFVGALRGDPLALWLVVAVGLALVAVVGWLWVRGGG